MNNWIKDLEEEIACKWQDMLNASPFSSLIISENFDKRLYGIYLLETYQYTLHNSRNQALVAVSLEASADIQYLKFCLKHAYEEAGHELMALHDLKALGPVIIPTPMPAPAQSTEVLISYLYHISKTGNLKGRLGYSLWAENAYSHIAPILSIVEKKLSLKASQMTFLGAHADIDVNHIIVVKEMIAHLVKTNDDRLAIRNVALTSLDLTGRMLNEIAHEYKMLIEKKSTKYTFLNSLL
jgi:hypothetical protein